MAGFQASAVMAVYKTSTILQFKIFTKKQVAESETEKWEAVRLLHYIGPHLPIIYLHTLKYGTDSSVRNPLISIWGGVPL